MGTQMAIDHIVFKNRADNCASRLFAHSSGCQWSTSAATFDGDNEGATFGVSDSPCEGDTCSGTVCHKLTTPDSSDASNPYTIDCAGATGRYVYVILYGTGRMLNFMDMEVHVSSTAASPISSPTAASPISANAALGKTSLQSSTYSNGVASNGNDGDSTTMAHTAGGTGETSPWWQVDMGTQMAIDHIVFKNRADNCASRLFAHSSGCQWSTSAATF